MEIDTTTLGDVEVGVDVADVDVDLDEVLRQKLGVRALMSVDVENLAIAAPVSTEVYEDAFVGAAGFGDAGFEVFFGVRNGGIEIFLDRRRHGHGDARSFGDGRWRGRDGGRGRRRLFASGDEERGCEEDDCDSSAGLADEVRRSHVRFLEVHRSSSAKCAAVRKDGLSGDTPLRGALNQSCDAEDGVFDSDLL